MKKVAILIVNGGDEPTFGSWITLCLEKIFSFTVYENYTVYLWNNNYNDDTLENELRQLDKVRLYSLSEGEKLKHPHAVPLKRLYEFAIKDGAEVIVTMDSDAHPIRKGWLSDLVKALDSGNVLSGVLRDELSVAIPPYIHASCLCTTPDYIRRTGKSLDYFAENTETVKHDTLSFLTEYAVEHNLQTYGLKRSNQRNFHRLIGGVYGDFIYHHGAGSRKNISFWDEKDKTEKLMQKNGKISVDSAKLLFKCYQEYIGWLTCNRQDENFFRRLYCQWKLNQLKKL